VAWKSKYDGEIILPPTSGGTLWDAIGQIVGAPNHDRAPLDPGTDAAIIARHIESDQKLCNVRASPRSVHTWEIPEMFGRTNKWERTVLDALLRRRRQKRVRDFGDADPVTAHALRHMLGKPVANTLRTLISKGYVRRVGAKYDLVRTFNGKFRRLSWNKPSPTVDTKFGDPYYFLHPEEDRAFTIREAARVQGFPDSFVFLGRTRSQYRMIGNAVPPPLARRIAEFIRDYLLY
jgi:DNA (cytosine-5)-methyltransferase 1